MCEKCDSEQALTSGRENEAVIRSADTGLHSDWHKADIIAAVKKKGSSFVALSRSSGLAGSTLANVLYRRWPKGERIVAEFIGVPPTVIWPERYRRDRKNE